MFRQIVLVSLVLKICQGDPVLISNKTGLAEALGARVNNLNIPSEADWRLNECVGNLPVKDQGQCNSCTVFAIVGTLESHACILSSKMVILSEQFLIDCLPSSLGCEPMSLLKTYTEILQMGGVLSANDYFMYEERQRWCRWRSSPDSPDLMDCPKFSVAQPSVLLIGMQRVKPNEEEMARVIAQYGPVTAAINSEGMMEYIDTNHIYIPKEGECDPNNLTHTITIMGYNSWVSNDGRVVDYWIIKNSWSQKFGDKGFYYLVRGRNACGIASDVVLPILAGN